MKKLIITIVILLVAIFTIRITELLIFPVVSMELGVSQLEDSNEAFQEMQAFEWGRVVCDQIIPIVAGILIMLVWLKSIKQLLSKGREEMKKLLLIAVLICAVLSTVGCRRPFDTPEYETIEHNETAFVIPLEGETSEQGKFDSAEYLESKQVATKRIRIPHRWNQTGRIHIGLIGRGNGEWIDTVTVLKVDRAPVTRQWTADDKTGTNTADEAIWVESKDSVTFSIGFSCTSFIEESKASLFLYKYTSSNLAIVMDTEIRARIQSIAAEKCGEYDLDDLRSKKAEIILAVRDDVILFFEGRGITVTTIGMFGGFSYQNPEIQVAIDAVFKAQTLEDVAEAKRKAALKEKDRIEILADAEAARISKIATAEADKIAKIAVAAEAAQKNPLFLSLRQLEVEDRRIEKWDGSYPRWYMGSKLSGASPGILLGVDIGEEEGN